jgi:GH24 family phage-related lysozyme (muramidase)
MPSPDTLNFLRHFEGLRTSPYRDTRGLWTWGYGCRITDPLLIAAIENDTSFRLTLEQADALLLAATWIAEANARFLFPTFSTFTPNQKTALISLSFHCGGPNLARFRQLTLAVNSHDWPQAALEVLFVDGANPTLASDYATEFPDRAKATADLLTS